MIADMHCDTLYEIRKGRAAGRNVGMRDTEDFEVNLQKMKKGNYLVQNFAVYIDIGEGKDPYEDAMELVQIFEGEMEKNADLIRPVTTAEEIDENARQGRLSAMLTLEEGAMCEGDVEKLKEFYNHGARMMTLTWNYENELATPATPQIRGESDPRNPIPDPTLPGLKKAGFEILEEMETLGMIPDVSHLSDAGFYDICENFRGPFVASHSNARALCNHGRNLSDDMIKKLGDHGGVAGLNYCPQFLSDATTPENELSLLVQHALHMIDCGGRACVGLGSDFDGFSRESAPKDAARMDDLYWAFHKAGLSDDLVDDILYGNVLRLYREVLH